MKNNNALTGLVQFKSSLFDLLVAKILSDDTTRVAEALAQHVAKAPDFFAGQSLALDFSALSEGAAPDFFKLAEHIQHLGCFLAGIVVPSHLEDKALIAGVPLLSKERAVAEPPEEDEPFRPSLIIEKPVRSGQKVYAENSDLVLLDVVNAGAEVAADGHIHSYAPLRGRAFAGLSGLKEARIFSLVFEAELVSIAGVHQALDRMDKSLRNISVQVYLSGNSLRIDRLISGRG